MKCVRLKLSERQPLVRPVEAHTVDAQQSRPRRYCQKRLIDPEHDEDPRWSAAAFERFKNSCIEEQEDIQITDNQQVTDENEEQYLSVLNIQFEGDMQNTKKVRSCFKYKGINNSKQHRMFVKEVVENFQDDLDDGRLSSYQDIYMDDYVKHIINKTEHSRPSTGKSSIYFQRPRYNGKGNKEAQVEIEHNRTKYKQTIPSEVEKKFDKKKSDVIHKDTQDSNEIEKISYSNVGKRKSLTISRAQSPETFQVIRVDVICNNSSSISSNTFNEDNLLVDEKLSNKKVSKESIKNTNFANKYLLTNTIKSLDQNVCGGKVTLLCKTFRLTDRSASQLALKSTIPLTDNKKDKTIKNNCTLKTKGNRL